MPPTLNESEILPDEIRTGCNPMHSLILKNDSVQSRGLLDKLNLGCGNEVLPGWVNHDLVPLPNVDVVHDLTRFPWPFENNQFREILMINVLEHLPDTVRTVEELHRIAKPGCKVTIRVPYWNSPDMFTDPTHRAFFNEHTFDFFDPASECCQKRPYYTGARFTVERISSYLRIFGHYIKVSNRVLNTLLQFVARFLCGVIWVQEVQLVALKEPWTESRKSSVRN